jgi:hypothetical protein
MNRTLSRTVLGLLVLVASGMVTGGAAQPPGASSSGADLSQVVDLPAACLSERNHGTCVDCCKEATGAPANVCSRFCKIVVPPPPEPQPEPQP